jgi:transcription antitermination factor NusG
MKNVTEDGGALSANTTQTNIDQVDRSIPLSLDSEKSFETSSWFAVRTQSRFEKKVAAELQSKGIRVFLPLYPAARQWTDRRKVVKAVLFPGYLFVHHVPSSSVRVSVLRTNGVIGFVGVRGMGTSIPNDEIEAIQTLLDKRVPFAPYAYIRIGQRVRIRGGALDGIKGYLAAINQDESLIISIDLIQRSVAISIKGYEIEPS